LGYTVGVRLHITFSSRYWFEANHGINAKIPQSLEEFKQFIEDWIRRREEKRRQTKEKMAQAMIKTIESSHAIIDGRGFRVLTPEEKTRMIQDIKRKYSS